MLTRLTVKGFKNLVEVDLRLGPFMCLGGPNGSGKSNVFDAIQFLSALADKPLLEAAMSVRGAGEGARGIHNLFTAPGPGEMRLEAEMLIPREGTDDLGQKAVASSTFVSYSITLRHQRTNPETSGAELILVAEDLHYFPKGQARANLPFPHSRSWRDSVVDVQRRTPYITTEKKDQFGVITLHQDGGGGGRPRRFVASSLPRTVLSTVNSQENRTAVIVRNEMRSWRLLQLEPSALRSPDDFQSPPRLSSKGEHLPATVHRLARLGLGGEETNEGRRARVFATLSNKLSELIDGVGELYVDQDEKREVLTLMMRDLAGTALPASSLSDGTLRFLALAVLELDPEEAGLLCLEEPENGIHPERVPAMLQLLQDIAADVNLQGGEDNPLRQVVINTHSPTVVAQVPKDGLLFAETVSTQINGTPVEGLHLRCLPATWRAQPPMNMPTIPLGRVMTFLDPVVRIEQEEKPFAKPKPARTKRVVDHVRQMKLPFAV
jgi:predicted ATPase